MKVRELMSLYITFLKALYDIHQRAHWKSSGENFYGNHLLFQRLYEGAQENLDEAAERIIGLFGELDERHDIHQILCEKFNAKNFDGNYVAASLNAEKMFLKFSELLYKTLKEKEIMTLGLDDLIMSIASKSEVHTYLLQQVLN